MEKVLKLYKYIDGINDAPFPSESEQIVVANFRYDAKRMSSAPTIVFTSMHRTCLDDLWSDNVYAIFNGERYFIKQTPTSSYSNADTRYKHEVELISERSILDNVFFYDVVTEDGAIDKPVSNSPKFSFYGDIHEYVSRLNHSLSFSGLEYSIVVDEGVNSNESLVSFDSQVITNALQEIYNIYNIPYYFNGKVIHVGYYKDDIDYVFKYGANDSLISISKQNANSKIINRITGVGSSDNIPYYYPNDDARGITRPLLNGGASGVSVINAIKYKKLRLSDELKYYSSINELVPLLNDDVFEVSNIKHLGVDESTGLTRYMIDFYYTFTLDAAKKVKFDIWSVDLEKTEDLKYNISKEGGQNFGYFSGEKDLELNDGTYTLIVRWLFWDEQPVLENDESTYNFINVYVDVSANIVVEASESWTLKGLPISLSDYGLNVDSASNGDVITIELLSYIQPQQKLMPPIYRYFLERFYEAKDNTFVDDRTGDYYVFENEYSTTHPREHIENFDNIKPTIKNVTNEHGDRIDRFVDFAYDLDDNDETDQDGNFYHPYFFAKLNKTNGIKGFNLFEHSIDESDMTISVTSGSCGSCEFIIGVDENTQKNLVQVDEYGDLLRDSNGNVRCGRKSMQKETPQDVQNDTENNEVWIALKKDIQTFGVVMPNATNNYKPSIGDTFVILHIDLPKTYIEEAEKKLEQELIRYMHDNNAEKFNFSISFSRIFFAENPSILERLSENSKIKIEYNKQVYELYASSLSYSISNDSPLPEIKIDLNDAITISQNQINQVVNSAKKDIISSIKKDVLWGDIKGVPSWITSEKPKYSYNEILGSVPQEESDVWVIKKDSNGNAYLFTTFPVITQYGITMYSGDGVDVPSLASGLPFDGRTIWYNPDTQQIEVIGGTGGGSGEGVSNFWDLSGMPSWITNSKPKYTYSEIEGTPDLTQYALVSQIPSLSGYATELWVTKQNYATKATTLSGYGITDAYTKTNVDDLLKSYVTLSGSQTITGEKNFTGGLKVNGSPIYYDTEKKYWKLEGDLLVTGGVTMYGSEGTFTPSTIMDAILYDDATLGINSNGQLYVKGGADDGINTTYLQNYLTQNSYLNVTSGDDRYLKLSGGTLTGNLTITTNGWGSQLSILETSSNDSVVRFYSNSKDEFLGALGFTPNKSPIVNIVGIGSFTIWHEGNFTPSNYLPLSGGTLEGLLSIRRNASFGLYINNTGESNATGYSGMMFQYWGNNTVGLLGDSSGELMIIASDFSNKRTILHSGNIGSYNAGSATKLQTARTIWGQSFDGTGNVNGVIYMPNNTALCQKDANGDDLRAIFTSAAGSLAIGNDHAEKGYITYLSGNEVILRYGKTRVEGLYLSHLGNVGIGTSSPQATFSVYGNIDLFRPNTSSYGGAIGFNRKSMVGGLYNTSFHGFQIHNQNGNLHFFIERTNTYQATAMLLRGDDGFFGIGIDNPSAKLHVSGDILATNSIKINSSAWTEFSITRGSVGTSSIGGLDNDGVYFAHTKDSTTTYMYLKAGSGLTVHSNILATGGITMYSMRKLKNVVDERGLSLSELSVIKPTRYTWKDGRDNRLHFGGIADDIQQVLPEVVYSTSEGILTMDYGNAAFAVASSLIKPVIDHEKRIAMLERENKQLRLEVERLKSA